MKRFVCSTIFSLVLSTISSAAISQKIGVFLGSYGDVDSKTEIEDLIKATFLDPGIVPIPPILRKPAANAYWKMNSKKYIENYSKIGFYSGMREESQKQADAVASRLRNLGYDAMGYYGFNLTAPYISEGLDQAREDGVERLIVMHQGAQYSKLTTGILFRDVKKYLNQHPDWQVEVIGIKSFAMDPRFIKLLGDQLQDLIDAESMNHDKAHLFLPIHGVPKSVIKEGDPYYNEAMFALKSLQYRFKDFHLTYGFQNHGEVPIVNEWTSPNEHKVIDELAEDECEDVIIYGRISYTLDFFNTKFEMAVEQKEHLEEESAELGKAKNVVVAKMFNSDPDFVEFLASVYEEALIGVGDLEFLN